MVLKAKTIYLPEELIEKITTKSATNNFSNRVQELIEKGLIYESKGGEEGVREAIISLVKSYNKKTNNPIPI